MTRQKIIIDSDAGYDDALALFMVLADAASEICAVTSVAGNFSVPVATQNIHRFMTLAGCKNIPVHSGTEQPPALARSHQGLGFGDDAPGVLPDGMAVQNIIALARQHPGEISVLAIGPLTTIAQAMMEDPELPGLLRQIVIMGGAIKACGRNQVAEYNFFVDPEAAAIVLRAPVKKTLIPLDLCNEIKLKLAFFQDHGHEALREMLLPVMASFAEGPEQEILVFDAIAAYFLTDPEAFTVEDMSIVVETQDAGTRGKCIVQNAQTPNVSVAVTLERAAFETALRAALERLRPSIIAKP